MKIPRPLAALVVVWTGLFWCGAVGIPLAAVFLQTRGLGQALLDPDVIHVAGVTLKQAFLSTVFSAAIGLPLGLAAARAGGRRRAAWLDSVLLLPSGVPTVVAATAWVTWLGRSGFLGRLDLAYSLSAVILAHVFFNAPWIAILVAQARRSVSPLQMEAAQTLGARGWQVFWWVEWPVLFSGFAAACAQVFALCTMSFALVLILGGGPPVETLETALYAKIRYGSVDLSGAVACAIWQVALSLPPWLGVLWLEAKRGAKRGGLVQVTHTTSGASGSRVRFSWGGGFAFVMALILILPYGAVFLPTGTHEGFQWLREIPVPLWVSLKIAAFVGGGTLVCGALATVAMSVIAERSRWLRLALGALLALPSGISILVLGLGTWMVYSRWIDPFEGSLAAIILLQVTLFFPLVLRMFWPVAQATQRAQLEAACSLGASPWRAFAVVEWPRWRAPVASAAALVSAASLGEVAAVSLFYSENLIPLPLLVSRWMGQYRFEEARGVSAILLIMSVIVTVTVSLTGRSKA
ncbi:ABC transporter permease subunit [Bdellovibrionota bacterium FG-1]